MIDSKHRSMSLLSVIILFHTVLANLLFEDDFANLNSWDIDIIGSSGHVFIQNLADRSVLSTNITFCMNEDCSRSQAKLTPDLRLTAIPSNEGLYWFGFNTFVDMDSNNANMPMESSYIFAILGGDNIAGRPPMLGLRVENNETRVVVCGNNHYSAKYCQYFSVGDVRLGTWEDWVIEDYLSTSGPTAYVKIWRNGKLVLYEKNLLTTYNDERPNYIKIGAYVPSWSDYEYYSNSPEYSAPTAQFFAVKCDGIKVGDASSYYYEVFTGMNYVPPDVSFSPTAAPTGPHVERASSSAQGGLDSQMVTLMAVLFGMCMMGITFSIFCSRGSDGKNTCIKCCFPANTEENSHMASSQCFAKNLQFGVIPVRPNRPQDPGAFHLDNPYRTRQKMQLTSDLSVIPEGSESSSTPGQSFVRKNSLVRGPTQSGSMSSYSKVSVDFQIGPYSDTSLMDDEGSYEEGASDCENGQFALMPEGNSSSGAMRGSEEEVVNPMRIIQRHSDVTMARSRSRNAADEVSRTHRSKSMGAISTTERVIPCNDMSSSSQSYIAVGDGPLHSTPMDRNSDTENRTSNFDRDVDEDDQNRAMMSRMVSIDLSEADPDTFMSVSPMHNGDRLNCSGNSPNSERIYEEQVRASGISDRRKSVSSISMRAENPLNRPPSTPRRGRRVSWGENCSREI
jgi:hypothetical protein